MDRRTVAARLRGVPGDGRIQGKPAWLLTTALAAIRRDGGDGRASPPEGPKVPPHLRPILDLPHGHERGAMLMHLWAFHHAPALAAWAVAEAGGMMDLAFEVARVFPMLLMIGTGKFGRGAGLQPWASADDPDIYDPGATAEVDWRRLRERTGEPGWRPPYPIPGFTKGAARTAAQASTDPAE